VSEWSVIMCQSGVLLYCVRVECCYNVSEWSVVIMCQWSVVIMCQWSVVIMCQSGVLL
jgi:hypothetical protein